MTSDLDIYRSANLLVNPKPCSSANSWSMASSFGAISA
jgi:hypothetical protein